jgi:hypothetical protein
MFCTLGVNASIRSWSEAFFNYGAKKKTPPPSQKIHATLFNVENEVWRHFSSF